MTGPVEVIARTDGRVAEVRLAAGKGNVLTREVIGRLDEVFGRLGEERGVRSVVLTADGPHFSFGASVAEHAPGEVERMLPAFHRLFRTIARSGLPIAAAVRGRCLGGGLELALAAHHLIVAEDAKLGVPEVTLGVFPPVAAAVLPLRCAQPTVDRLIGTGEVVGAEEAVALGLADAMAPVEEAEARARAWAERYAGLSSVAVRFATRAARIAWADSIKLWSEAS